MSILSRRGRLAIAAVVDIAVHAVHAPVSAKALAARHNLPPRHLEPLLQALVRAGILKGMRGPRGGYDVARDRHRISCAEIVRTAVGAGIDDFDAISPLIEAIIVPAMAEAERDYFDRLGRISVADLCDKVAEARETVPGLLEPA
ncbi:MAG: Rrf2 family transcriptional regulator [Phreatobacter sp.]|jgi:Rrf2 family iron-sulfur cluster assembly transcriptional regulator|nr:Rrf2 family transcriptional regulator [Phreatobacter sp.]